MAYRPVLLSPADTAALIGRPIGTLRRWASEGRITSYGGRYDWLELAKLAREAAQTGRPVSPPPLPHAKEKRPMTPAPNRLRAWRTERGYTLAEVAALTGLTSAAISRIETGKRTPAVDTRVTIARRLGIPLAELFPAEHVDATRAGKAGAV